MNRIIVLIYIWMISVSVLSQSMEDNVGMIALNPYIPDSENMDFSSKKLLTDKLQRSLTFAGISGEGFEKRFVITPHIEVLDKSETITMPAKIALRLSISIYIGDGFDGTLYSSYNKVVKGIGDNYSQAYRSAFQKLNSRDEELQRAIEVGKERIIQYYNLAAPRIVDAARAAGNNGSYDEAVAMLVTIPLSNYYYNEAQNLIYEYLGSATERHNSQIINEAKAVWSSSTDEFGAAKAVEILNRLENPSENILIQAQALEDSMAKRMMEVSDREYQLRVKQIQNEHKEEMVRIKSETRKYEATMNAAAAVATAYYNSQPRITYHVHSWWW